MPSSNMLLLNFIPLIDVTFSTPTPVYNSYHAPVRHNPAFDYGDSVRVSGGEHKGRTGAVVAINGSESSRTYTVEFGDGTDSEIGEGLLLRDEDGLSPTSPA